MDIKQDNSDYLKITEIEQSFVKLRWTIVTFFITVSFAIFSFSLQSKSIIVPIFLQQSLAILVYWFAFLVHVILYKYTVFLRNYLKDMENKNQTSLRLRTETDKHFSKGNISITQLFIILGVMYTIIALTTIYIAQ